MLILEENVKLYIYIYIYIYSGGLTDLKTAHLSGTVLIYFLRTSTLICYPMPSATQANGFPLNTIDLSSLFSNSPQICSMGLRSGL